MHRVVLKWLHLDVVTLKNKSLKKYVKCFNWSTIVINIDFRGKTFQNKENFLEDKGLAASRNGDEKLRFFGRFFVFRFSCLLWKTRSVCVGLGGGVRVYACLGERGKGQADELHFLLGTDRASMARSPINRLKDKGVRKMSRPSLCLAGKGWKNERNGERPRDWDKFRKEQQKMGSICECVIYILF